MQRRRVQVAEMEREDVALSIKKQLGVTVGPRPNLLRQTDPVSSPDPLHIEPASPSTHTSTRARLWLQLIKWVGISGVDLSLTRKCTPT